MGRMLKTILAYVSVGLFFLVMAAMVQRPPALHAQDPDTHLQGSLQPASTGQARAHSDQMAASGSCFACLGLSLGVVATADPASRPESPAFARQPLSGLPISPPESPPRT